MKPVQTFCVLLSSHYLSPARVRSRSLQLPPTRCVRPPATPPPHIPQLPVAAPLFFCAPPHTHPPPCLLRVVRSTLPPPPLQPPRRTRSPFSAATPSFSRLCAAAAPSSSWSPPPSTATRSSPSLRWSYAQPLSQPPCFLQLVRSPSSAPCPVPPSKAKFSVPSRRQEKNCLAALTRRRHHSRTVKLP